MKLVTANTNLALAILAINTPVPAPVTPAAWAAKNYKPIGTPSDKSWCLPSGALLQSSLNNRTNFSKVNAGITTAEGIKLGYGGQPSYSVEYVWSSSEKDGSSVLLFTANTSGLLGMSTYYKSYYGNYYTIRPVLAF